MSKYHRTIITPVVFVDRFLMNDILEKLFIHAIWIDSSYGTRFDMQDNSWIHFNPERTKARIAINGATIQIVCEE